MRWTNLAFTIIPLLAFAFALVGCGTNPEENVSNSVPDMPSDPVDAHDHPAEGPHGGDITDLGGGEYHAEVLHDEKAGTVTVYILDGSAKKTVPIDATEVLVNLKHEGKPEQFKLAASPDKGDPKGKSSRFVSNDSELAKDLDGEAAAARLVVEIAGKSYSGELEHHHGHAGGHKHSHAGDDALVWRRDVEHAGYTIRLGHHGNHLHAGKPVEPAIGITRDGKPVSEAKAFNSLLADDNKTIMAQEVATVYEPLTADEPAHYAQGALTVSKDAKRVVIRYRIVLPNDAGEVTYDVPVDVE